MTSTEAKTAETVKALGRLSRWTGGEYIGEVYLHDVNHIDLRRDVRDALDLIERLEGEKAALKALLAQRTADIAKAQPDPSIRRLSEKVLNALAESAEAQWALAETEDERVEATGLEMLVAWQREPCPATPADRGDA